MKCGVNGVSMLNDCSEHPLRGLATAPSSEHIILTRYKCFINKTNFINGCIAIISERTYTTHCLFLYPKPRLEYFLNSHDVICHCIYQTYFRRFNMSQNLHFTSSILLRCHQKLLPYRPTNHTTTQLNF